MGCTPATAPKPTRKVSVDTRSIMRELSEIPQEYAAKKLLGHGRYGRVLLGESSETHQQVAIKAISKENTDFTTSRLREEIDILSQVDHPNIVKYLEHFESDKYLYIVMEYCSGGDLFHQIVQREKFSEAEAAGIIQDILRGINHCHHMGIIHRDLKPENIMYSAEGVIKIIDFGLSMKEKSYSSEKLAGTAYYIAPEILRDEIFTKACDIWSLGILLHILLSGYVPIAGGTIEEIYDRIMEYKGPSFVGDAWNSVSAEAKDLVRQMLNPDYEKRISAAEALKHPWFNLQKSDTCDCNPQILDSLRRYSGFSKLKKKALNLLARNINEVDLKKFQQAFLELDKEKTGLITCGDLKECLKNGGYTMTAEELENLTRKVNYNGEAFINYTEFLAATVATKQFLTEEKLWSLFKSLDLTQRTSSSTERSGLKHVPSLEKLRSSPTEEGEPDFATLTFEKFKEMLRDDADGIGACVTEYGVFV